MGQIVDVAELAIRNPNDVARLEDIVAADLFAIDERAVAAVEITQGPFAAVQKDFDVVAAAAFVLDDNLIGAGSAHSDGSARHQTENVGPLGTFADHKVCKHAGNWGEENCGHISSANSSSIHVTLVRGAEASSKVLQIATAAWPVIDFAAG